MRRLLQRATLLLCSYCTGKFSVHLAPLYWKCSRPEHEALPVLRHGWRRKATSARGRSEFCGPLGRGRRRGVCPWPRLISGEVSFAGCAWSCDNCMGLGGMLGRFLSLATWLESWRCLSPVSRMTIEILFVLPATVREFLQDSSQVTGDTWLECQKPWLSLHTIRMPLDYVWSNKLTSCWSDILCYPYNPFHCILLLPSTYA